jgi:aminomethyltransferase
MLEHSPRPGQTSQPFGMHARTPLEAMHADLGATFTEFAGWRMPLRYGSDIAEHAAVRGRAGLFDLSHMGQIEISGADACAALDYAVVGYPSAIKVGGARYSMLCLDSGGILDDVVIYRLAETRYLLVANASNRVAVAEALRQRCDAFAAMITDLAGRRALIALQGPRSQPVLQRITDVDLGELRYYRIRPLRLADHDVLIARTGYTGEDGFEIYCSADDAVQLWARISMAGGNEVVPAGLACRDSLRLEAGMPLYGNELTTTLTPYDAGLGRLVALDKPGGFVGRDALRRFSKHRASRQLVGLRLHGRRAARAGCMIVDDAGARVGMITSGGPSPTLGYPIAMAYIAVDLAGTGNTVDVEVRGRREHAEVVELPFYRRST